MISRSLPVADNLIDEDGLLQGLIGTIQGGQTYVVSFDSRPVY